MLIGMSRGIALIPSTARSASSLAQPLPAHLTSLLKGNFDKAINSLSKILPEVRKINVLEEAEFEPFGDGGFEHERTMQTFENLRVFRPRLLVAGKQGMGQNFLGSAILHHLEGFHVQSLDLATLVGDPARVSIHPLLMADCEANTRCEDLRSSNRTDFCRSQTTQAEYHLYSLPRQLVTLCWRVRQIHY